MGSEVQWCYQNKSNCIVWGLSTLPKQNLPRDTDTETNSHGQNGLFSKVVSALKKMGLNYLKWPKNPFKAKKKCFLSFLEVTLLSLGQCQIWVHLATIIEPLSTEFISWQVDHLIFFGSGIKLFFTIPLV